MKHLICYKRTGAANIEANGKDFSDDLTEVKKLEKIELYGNHECVTKIVSTYRKTDGTLDIQEHGSGGESQGSPLELENDEYFVYCAIRYDDILNLLILETNKKRRISAGGAGGNKKWEISAKEQNIDAFYGFYGKMTEKALSSFGLFGPLYK